MQFGSFLAKPCRASTGSQANNYLALYEKLNLGGFAVSGCNGVKPVEMIR